MIAYVNTSGRFIFYPLKSLIDKNQYVNIILSINITRNKLFKSAVADDL